jgi:hypothetical protein
MTKLPITKKVLLSQYKRDINKMLDECDWIDHIEDWRMIGTIGDIITKKGLVFEEGELLKLYNKKVKSLKLTDQEWRDQYANWDTGLPKIIDMVYEIIENKFCGSK